MSARDSRPPETLAERFWSLARGMEGESDSDEPSAVVAHVLRVLDALDSGKVGKDLTVNTVNFLALLRQQEVKGDLLYASPEQARGEQVDERSLVFSVGVLLFEKLTGRHPFGAEGNPQRLARIRRGEMASGVNYFPRVPAELRVVLVKAMGPFPEERWESLAELRTQLEMFLDRSRHPEDYSAPRSARPLPALPDDEPTQIINRRAAEPQADLQRMARVSARQSAVRLETQPASELTAGDELPAAATATLPPVTGRRPGGLLAGVAIGVVATALAAWAMWPEATPEAGPAVATGAAAPGGPAAGGPVVAPAAAAAGAPGQAPSAALAEGDPAELEAGEATPPPETAQPAAPAPGPARPAPAAPAAAAPGRAPAGEPGGDPAGAPAGEFDIDVGASRALAAARGCLAGDRRVQFGASLLYAPRTGASRKVFFGAASQLTPVERGCISTALVGIDAGGPPPKPTVVTYTFSFAPGRDDVKGRLAPGP